MLIHDVLPHLLGLPLAVALGLDVRGRRRRWLSAWLLASLAAVGASAVISGFVFAPMRALAHVVFVQAPVALALAAVRARPGRPPASAFARAPWWAWLAGALTLVAIAVDAFVVEPRALELNRHTIRSARVTEPIRIVVLADLQFDAWTDHERSAIDRAVAERPDVVLLPGDYAQRHDARRAPLLAEARAYLAASGLAPRHGIHAVEGNVDLPGWETMFDDAVTVFTTDRTVRRGPIRVTGLTLGSSFDRAIEIPRGDGFHIVLGHAPDFSLGDVDADLLVAGHTHGGQVQLPLLGALVTFSAVPRHQAEGGVFERPGGGHLVVSRGIGMERGDAPRLRFRCRPEIVVIDVVPAR